MSILLKVQTFLGRVAQGEVQSPPGLSDEFAQLCKNAWEKTFVERAQDEKFRFRMSNVGRPECQLEQEMAGASAEGMSYSDKFKLFTGDILEGAAVLTMKAAGVNIIDTNQKVSLDIGGIQLDGTYDICIDEGDGPGVYDIKTASKYAFHNKFTNQSLASFAADDAFGYVGQAACYSAAKGVPFKGWIVICKETGEWTLLSAEDTDQSIFDNALQEIDGKIRRLTARAKDAPFIRCFTDQEETYYKKATGNRVLGFTCGYCPYKWACWPGLKTLPSLASKAKNAPYVYYTHIKPEELPNEVG
jgi:hypothetical protein